MQQFIFDGTFEGLLTAVFEIYERKALTPSVVREALAVPSLLYSDITVATDHAKAQRVWSAFQKKVSASACSAFYKAFLSEQPNVDVALVRFMQYAFASSHPIEKDFTNDNVLLISQTAKKVHREKHRMEAFVRFQCLEDNLYTAVIAPDYNVLPLIVGHFKDRYADQHWLIYDVKRDYGIQYNFQDEDVSEVVLDRSIIGHDTTRVPLSICHEHEEQYQSLWKTYFSNVNILARKNTKLHKRHIPSRYWRYLMEKD